MAVLLHGHTSAWLSPTSIQAMQKAIEGSAVLGEAEYFFMALGISNLSERAKREGCVVIHDISPSGRSYSKIESRKNLRHEIIHALRWKKGCWSALNYQRFLGMWIEETIATWKSEQHPLPRATWYSFLRAAARILGPVGELQVTFWLSKKADAAAEKQKKDGD